MTIDYCFYYKSKTNRMTLKILDDQISKQNVNKLIVNQVKQFLDEYDTAVIYKEK